MNGRIYLHAENRRGEKRDHRPQPWKGSPWLIVTEGPGGEPGTDAGATASGCSNGGGHSLLPPPLSCASPCHPDAYSEQTTTSCTVMVSPPSSRLSGKKQLFPDSSIEALAWHIIGGACIATHFLSQSFLRGGRIVGAVQPLAMPVPGSREGVVSPTQIPWLEIEEVLFLLLEPRFYELDS